VARRLLNRLTDRTYSSNDAVNAYVEGTASSDEIRLVKEMVRKNVALEKDLYTQQALRAVLGKIEKIEAPRSFAITPEMVAAAAGSDSWLSRLAEVFETQRKLALAPAIIAVIAALSVALLTIGDITGVVDQSDSSFSMAAIAESDSTISGSATGSDGPTGASGAQGNPGSPGSLGSFDQSAVTTEMAAAVQAPTSADAGLGLSVPEPTGQAASAPFERTVDDAGGTALLVIPEGNAIGELSTTKSAGPDESIANNDLIPSDAPTSPSLGTEFVYGGELVSSPSSNKGISLPLRQLQAGLAALAVAAIGAWVGLRRARGE